MIPTLAGHGRRVARATAFLPFLLFIGYFGLLPAGAVLLASVQRSDGGFTWDQYRQALGPQYIHSLLTTLTVAGSSAVLGGAIGLVIARAIHRLGQGPLRALLVTLSAVTANFAGIPLAFAYMVSLGISGIYTMWLRQQVHLHLYAWGFSLTHPLGLILVYMSFQVPLMTLLMLPAFAGIAPLFWDAASSMGASPLQYRLRVEWPLLLPAFLGNMALLFANAFAAYATAYALAGGTIDLLPIQIGYLVNGNVLFDDHLGDALGMLMAAVLILVLLFYWTMQRLGARWQA